VLRAYSRLLEQLMLVGDLLLVAGSWLLAYLARFYVIGPQSRHGIPPLEPYLLMLLPILVVWGIAFRAFDLYHPRRIGSRLSEVAGIAKASAVPHKDKIGKVTRAQVREIAQTKLVDLNTDSIESAMRTVEGTARSMGVVVQG